MKALEIKNLNKSYGEHRVLKNISMEIEEGERRAVIGPTGAGKTMLFNIIGGTEKPDEGEILFFGKKINRLTPYKRAKLGLIRVFRTNSLYSNLSVEENLLLAAKDIATRPDSLELLGASALWEKKDVLVKDLSYGQKKQVELLAALGQTPRFILLDEPTAGMSESEVPAIMQMIASLPRSVAVLMVEHDLEAVFGLADRVTVLHMGEVICEEDREKIRSDPRVREVYTGRK